MSVANSAVEAGASCSVAGSLSALNLRPIVTMVNATSGASRSSPTGLEESGIIGIGPCQAAPVSVRAPRKELVHRLRKRWCELCEHGATVAAH